MKNITLLVMCLFMKCFSLRKYWWCLLKIGIFRVILAFFKILFLEDKKVKDSNLLVSIYIAYLWKYYVKIGVKVNQISQRIVIKARIPCFDLGEKFFFWNKQYTSSSLFVILLRIGLFISLSQIVLLGKKNIWGLNKNYL